MPVLPQHVVQSTHLHFFYGLRRPVRPAHAVARPPGDLTMKQFIQCHKPRIRIKRLDLQQTMLLAKAIGASPPVLPASCRHQRGSAMIEFAVVAPIITLFGLAILQYGMLFFAKNQINHASFMAARAGSTGNADLGRVHTAYASALVPLYGGGQTAVELAMALAKASVDIGTHTRIELLNPTRESFDDWNDSALQAALASGSKRVIPNSNQAFKDQSIGASSGQTIQDANLIKLRITHGYEPKVPLVAGIYKFYLQMLDPKTDAFHSQLVAAGRIPVVTSVTLQMQSDAIEASPVSMPGIGIAGNPLNSANPRDPPQFTTTPPNCATTACAVILIPESSPPSQTATDCIGENCIICT